MAAPVAVVVVTLPAPLAAPERAVKAMLAAL
jgi:hypothetical protein